jgi:hypothetical protein
VQSGASASTAGPNPHKRKVNIIGSGCSSEAANMVQGTVLIRSGWVNTSKPSVRAMPEVAPEF